MRLPRPAVLLAATALCASVPGVILAQTPGTPSAGTPSAGSQPAAPAPGQAASPATPPAGSAAAGGAAAGAAADAAKPDPVIAKVNGQEIHLSDLQAAAQGLPEQYRALPLPMLYPLLLDQLVDQKAIAIEARKDGLDKDPQVRRDIARAEDRVLQNAVLSREVSPGVTDAAVRAVYDRDYANKPGEPEIHAAHILVGSEDEAKKIIAQLKAGADFSELAKKNSTEPGAKDRAGDLGWFKKGDMVPEFANAAFAMKPGQVTDTPVKTQFGWHVIKVLEARTAPPVPFDEAKDEIRQKLIAEGVQKAMAKARAGVTVEKFNPDGTPQRATDAAEPPPAPGGAAGGGTAAPARR